MTYPDKAYRNETLKTATQAVMPALGRNWVMVNRARHGMDEAVLARQAKEHCNSTAWIFWHVNRVMDICIHTHLPGHL